MATVEYYGTVEVDHGQTPLLPDEVVERKLTAGTLSINSGLEKKKLTLSQMDRMSRSHLMLVSQWPGQLRLAKDFSPRGSRVTVAGVLGPILAPRPKLIMIETMDQRKKNPRLVQLLKAS